MEQQLTQLAERVECVEKEIKLIKRDTSELLEIFNASKTGANVLLKIGKFIKWIGGIAVAVYAIWKTAHIFGNGTIE